MTDEQQQPKSARLRRRIQRELAWLSNMGIARDHSVPLYPGQNKTGNKYLP